MPVLPFQHSDEPEDKGTDLDAIGKNLNARKSLTEEDKRNAEEATRKVKRDASKAKASLTRQARKVQADVNKAKATINKPSTLFDDLQKKKDEQLKQAQAEARAYAQSHPEAQKQFKDIQAALKGKSTPSPKPKKPELSPQDRKILDAIKNAGKSAGVRLPRTTFNLPQFTSDNATGIVLACILICFGLELNAGTKFVTLWNDAFSPGSNSNTSSTTPNQDHTAANAAVTTSEAALVNAKESIGQNVDALASSAVAMSHGGGTFTEYGVPSSFHFLDGVIW